MKGIFLIASVVFICSCQENKEGKAASEEVATEAETEKTAVPEAVTKNFSVAYPGATEVKWEQENGMHEASFKNGSLEMSAMYKTDGSFAGSEIEISADQLPEAVSKAAVASGTVKEASKMTLADGSILYEAEIGDKEFLYDDQGKLVREETGDNEDDDD